MKARLLALAVAATALVQSSDADACSGPLLNSCRGAKVVVAPADPPWIGFYPAFDSGGVNRLTAIPQVEVRDSGGTKVDVTITADPSVADRWVVTPATKLAAGAKYKVTWTQSCEQSLSSNPEPAEKEIEIPQSAPLPTKLGTASATYGPVERSSSVASSSCDTINYTGDEVVAEVTVAFDPSFAPWLDAIPVERLLDGKPLPEEAHWDRKASDMFGRLRASCDSPDVTGITPAKHTITFRALVPGQAEPLTAETTVDFTCASTPTSSSSSGVVGGGEGSTSGGGGGPSPESSDSGCAMATSSTATLSASALLIFASSLALARRRRSNRSSER